MEKLESLRALALVASNIENSIIAAEGEIDELLEKDLSLNDISIANKVDAYYYTLQKIEKTVQSYKEEMKAIDSIISRLEGAEQWMLNNLQSAATTLNRDHLSGNKYVASLVLNNPRVEVINEEAVPVEFKSEKITIAIDKKKIAEGLKLGIEIEGVRLTQSKRIKFKVKSELLE